MEPGDEARFRFGALRFTPTIALTNLGVDTNVFNAADNPQRDTTAALGPAVNLWLKAGPSRLSGKVTAQYMYFNENASLRSWSTASDGRWEVPLGRITPFVTGAYVNTYQRQGFEIDSYAHQRTGNAGVGADVEFGGKTKLTFTGAQSTVVFDEGETFDGVELAPALNRKTSAEQLQVRYKLTPLTTFVVAAQGLQDRFTLDPVRDSNSLRVLPGFEFKPFALISGNVAVGYRWFTALDQQTMPNYQGVIAAVDAQYVLGANQLIVKVSRDLVYSFETTEPYYALTDLTLNLTRRVTSTWDVVGRAGWQALDYSEFASSTTPAHTDKGSQYGGGIGYRMGRAVRFGFDATYASRRSVATPDRDYEGLRYGVSISYGTQP